MSDVVINFVGNTQELKPVENALDTLIKKEGEVGQAWEKTNSKISSSTKSTTDSSNKLAKSIDDLAKAAKSMDKVVIGGAYKEYLKQIQAQLGLTNKQVIEYIRNAKLAAQQAIFSAQDDAEIKELTISIEAMNAQLKELGATEDGTEQKTLSLRSQMKALKEELARMENAGEDTSQAYIDMAVKAGKLDDQIGDLNAQIKHLGSDTKNIDGLISLVSGVAGGFAAVQGVMGLVAGENEDLQKALLKVNSAMSILQGLQQVTNVLQRESAGSLLVGNVLRTSQTTTTVAATGATTALNTAMRANPIGLVITGLVALVTAISIFSDSSKDAAEEQEKYNEKLLDRIKLEERLKSLQLYGTDKESNAKNLKIEVDFAEARNTSELELNKLKQKSALADKEAADESIEDLKRKYGERTVLDTEYRELKGKIDNETNEAAKKALVTDLDVLETKISKTEDAYNKSYEANREFTKLGYQKDKILADNAAKDTIARAEIALANSIANSRKELESRKGIIMAKTADEIRNVNLTEIQRKAIIDKSNREISELQFSYDIEHDKQKLALLKAQNAFKIVTLKENSLEELRLMQDSLLKERNLALKEARGNEDAKKVIRQEYENDKLKVLTEYTQKANQIELENEIFVLDAKIAAFGLSEEKKLSLALERLDAEKNKELDAAIAAKKSGKELNAIYLKYVKLSREAKLASIETVKNKQIEALRDANEIQKRLYESVLSNENASEGRKVKALQNLKALADAELKIEFDKLEEGKLLNENYERDLLKLQNKRVFIAQDIAQKITAIELSEIDKRAAKIKLAFDFLLKGLGGDALTTSITNFGQTAFNVFERLKVQVKSYNAIIAKGNEDGASPEEIAAKKAAIEDKAAAQDSARLAVKVAAIAAAQDVINGIYAAGAAKRQQQLTEEIAALEEQKKNELSNKNLSEQQKADIDTKFRERERKIKRDAFIADKEAKIGQTIINGIVAAVAALPNLVLAGIVAATTAIAVAKISATPIPKFKKGQVDIQGPGTTTSDSIPAMISRGESVIKADSTMKWKDALQAINNDKFEHYLTNKFKDFVFPHVPEFVQSNTANNNKIDYDKLADAVANKMRGVIPAAAQIHNNIDGDSLKAFLIEGKNKTEIKNKYFSMT